MKIKEAVATLRKDMEVDDSVTMPRLAELCLMKSNEFDRTKSKYALGVIRQAAVVLAIPLVQSRLSIDLGGDEGNYDEIAVAACNVMDVFTQALKCFVLMLEEDGKLVERWECETPVLSS